jgi:S1-C subfamily serine protease
MTLIGGAAASATLCSPVLIWHTAGTSMQRLQFFAQLCGIGGPGVAVHHGRIRWRLHAQLRDGSVVHGQEQVTALAPALARLGIGHVQLALGEQITPGGARYRSANPAGA